MGPSFRSGPVRYPDVPVQAQVQAIRAGGGPPTYSYHSVLVRGCPAVANAILSHAWGDICQSVGSQMFEVPLPSVTATDIAAVRCWAAWASAALSADGLRQP